MKILIMGLPGSGKTVLAGTLFVSLLKEGINTAWYNADTIRELFNDWNFSVEGRIRQAQRMKDLADNQKYDVIICDFVAPIVEMRDIFQPDYMVWVDTIAESRFADTTQLFVQPSNFDLRVTSKDANIWSKIILEHIKG